MISLYFPAGVSIDTGMNVHGLAMTEDAVSDSKGMDPVTPANTAIAKVIASGADRSIARFEQLSATGILPVIPSLSHSIDHGNSEASWHDQIVRCIQDEGIYALHKKYGYGGTFTGRGPDIAASSAASVPRFRRRKWRRKKPQE